MPKILKKKTNTTKRTTQLSIAELVKQLNSFNVDNYWDVGRFLVDKVMPVARKQGMYEEQVLKLLSSQPGIKFPFTMLKQCQKYYTYYPDVKKRPLPEIFYFDLATKVDDSKKRDQYERLSIEYRWTISDLRKRIRDDELARRIDERTKYGFELRERNVWSFDTPDPRFGKPNFKGRLPGQIIANALYYYTKPGDYIVDPFAGSGTLGDIIDTLPYFSDRKYKMYDINPVDDRIVRNNILLTGIPEQTGTVDYIFLEPPSEFSQKDSITDFEVSIEASKADFILKFKGILRECVRILKPGGKFSIVLEAAFVGNEFCDFPAEITHLCREMGLKPSGKVYLPKRSGDSMAKLVHSLKTRILTSDCREILTFQKP